MIARHAQRTNAKRSTTTRRMDAALPASGSGSGSASSSTLTSYETLPKHNSTYKEQGYWDERFQHESKYEWLTGYGGVRELLAKHVRRSDKILMVGCGNSELSAQMYLDGYENITNVDYSSVVIERHRALHADKPNMTWHVMDMTDLTFADGSFTVVLDKCAMDALVVDEGDPWDPRPAVRRRVHHMLRHVSRCLTPDGGRFVQISFGQPHFRKGHYLDKPAYAWNVASETFGDGWGFFCYVMTRHEHNEESRAAALLADELADGQWRREAEQEEEEEKKKTVKMCAESTQECSN